jgi:hypothetical protein
MTVEVPLSKGYVALIDEQDAERVLARRWRIHTESRDLTFIYAVSGFGAGRVVRMHRMIIDAPVGMLVDHLNGETLDNRRENLRLTDGIGKRAQSTTVPIKFERLQRCLSGPQNPTMAGADKGRRQVDIFGTVRRRARRGTRL